MNDDDGWIPCMPLHVKTRYCSSFGFSSNVGGHFGLIAAAHYSNIHMCNSGKLFQKGLIELTSSQGQAEDLPLFA